MSECEAFWSGPFGAAYTERNRVDWRKRRSFWELMLERTQVRSVLEVGCNAAWNLLALRDADPSLKLRGVDVNEKALAEAKAEYIDARQHAALEVGALWPARFGLTFTAGVLIHVPPDDLTRTMLSIAQASNHYVLAIEYAAAMPEEIDYRGHAGRLWKRPYGELYEDMGLVIEAVGELGEGDGFGPGCTYWLLRKP